MSAARFRAALERALAVADADERIGPTLAATDLRMRFVFTDAELMLDVSAGDGEERNLRWSFDGDAQAPPRLELWMATEVANRYLQGNESLAIAIARGRIRCRGESRSALRFLPAIRLICGPYRQVIEDDFPDLVAG